MTDEKIQLTIDSLQDIIKKLEFILENNPNEEDGAQIFAEVADSLYYNYRDYSIYTD